MPSLGTITGQEIKKNRNGEVDVRLLQVQFSNERDIQTVQHFNPSGEDSAPIKGDQVLVLDLGLAYKVAVGMQDILAAVMGAGEKKLYSRDVDGNIAAFVNLLSGGNIELNGNADFAARFSNLESMVSDLNTKYDAHTHPDPVSGSTGTPSNAPLGLDISGAKVDTVLLP
jgi:phage gp45-like